MIIPTHKRPLLLRECLRSVFEQEYPRDRFEVIVVMDGKDEATESMLKGLTSGFHNLRYVGQENKGPAAARNLGIRSSSGEIVGFIDDDCVLDKDWVKLMIQAHLNNPAIAAVGGLTIPSNQNSAVLASQFLSNCSIETFFRGVPRIIFFPTCNVSLKRHIFEAYQFDESFPFPGGEDLELFWKLFKEGYHFIWDKEIKIIHCREETTRSFFRQAYTYGRGNFLVQYLHGDQPLLKELKTGWITFWFASLINLIKIPRFSYSLGSRLIRENNIGDVRKKMSIYGYFVLHKMFYLLGNIAEFIRTRKGYFNEEKKVIQVPRLLILDITHSCNLHCRICDIWKTGKREKDIGIAHIKKMLFEAKSLKINEISLSGGEALLRKDIFEILDYARKLEIKNLGVLTNGILVKENLDKLNPYLFDNTVSLVMSFDSLNKDLHNFIRNSTIAWQETVAALNLLSVLKKEKPQVNFNVISIILNQNLEELLGLARYIKSIGADSLQFQALLPNNLRMAVRNESSFWVSRERFPLLDSIIDELVQFKNENPGFIRNSIRNLELIKKYFRGILTSTDVRCVSARETILVSNQGNCTTCFSTYGDAKIYKLKDILNRKEIIRSRENVENCHWPCLLPCFCDMSIGDK